MQRNNKKFIISAVLFIAGICLIAFPFLKESYQDYKQQKIMNEWRQGLLQVEDLAEGTDSAVKKEEQEAAEGERQVAGILEIDSIDLMQPVLKGSTKSNLNYSVSTLEPTGVPGEIGNFVITGHNSRTFGRHFNRLHEVKEGDIVKIILQNQTISYEIDSIQVIEAEDIWIAESDEENSRITLITCYYAEDGTTKRLAVQGHKI